MLSISVAHLLNREVGSREDFTLEANKLDIPETIPAFSKKLTLDLTLYKLEEAVSVEFKDIDTCMRMVCDKCILPYEQNIHISQTERIYYLNRPRVIDDLADLYLINKKKLTIELDECIRQEILLHFPSQQVCSKSCKGLCQTCGKNQNTQNCRCKHYEEKTIQYFRNLKDIYYHSNKK